MAKRPTAGAHGQRGLWARAVRQLLSRRQTRVCLAILAGYLLIALLGSVGLLPDYQERVAGSYAEPSVEQISLLLGCDVFGRSVLYKILASTKTAMTVGFLVPAIAVPLGLALGALAGYYGGKIDGAIVWLFSVIVSVPYILIVIAISFVLGKGLAAISVAMGAVGWVTLCRLVRAEFLKHRDREYALSSKLLGASDLVIIVRHILPNVLHIAIISASLQALVAIKSEVILTYLGVGVQDGASWGTMISDATGELTAGVYWPFAGVVLAMFAVIYALNVVGDALRDALDPRLLE